MLVIANLSSGEKNIEHKIERLYPSEDPQFLRAIGLPLGSPVVGGNRFDLLMNGEPIFPLMMKGTRSARRTISFGNFIYRDRGIGEQIASALPDEARRESPCMICLTVGSSKMDERYLRMLREKIVGRVTGFARCEGK